jgi:TsgA-like MFS transporter
MKADANTKIVLFISYLCYFFVGSLFTTVGVFLPSVGKYFTIDAASLGYIYTFLNAGLFLTIIFSGNILKIFDFKKILTTLCVLVIASIFTLNFYHTVYSYSAVMLILGAVAGIVISAGSYLVVRVITNLDQRASKLIFTDFFFSLAGMILPSVFGAALARHAQWFSLYNIIMIPCIMMLYALGKADFGFLKNQQENAAYIALTEVRSKSIYIVAVAALLFIFAELSLMMWLVKYLETVLHFPLDTASLFVTIYWLSKAAGLLVNQFTVLKLGIKRYLFLSVSLGMAAFFILTQATTFSAILVSLVLFGFVNSGIYAALISYGCMQHEKPSPKTVAFIIASGSAGTLLSGWVSGLIVNYSGLYATIKFSALIYFLCLVAISLVTVGYSVLKRRMRLAAEIE